MDRVAVLVPAWNEAATIGATLRSLALQVDVHVDVVVVANGCTDRTSEIAKKQLPLFLRGGHSLTVLEIGSASKSIALNHGEAALTGYPRAFIDADVLLTANAIAAVARDLAVEEARLVAPCLKFTVGVGRAGRIARLLEDLPPFCNDVVGGGFYAVNRKGRQRWDLFPTIIADDAYVCGLFRREERVRATEAAFFARFPTDEALPGVLARWRAGRHQLKRLGFALSINSRFDVVNALISKPYLWAGAVEYAFAWLTARRSAATMLANSTWSWARADTRVSEAS